MSVPNRDELGVLAANLNRMSDELARLFREIAEKGEQLEIASRHKSEFLASMSHELRTPLNAILGFNEMILGGIYGEVPADMQAPLADIQTSGKHLLRLINNVLDLAKIEAGRMELALADYAVHEMVEKRALDAAARWRRKRGWSSSPRCPPTSRSLTATRAGSRSA